MFETKNLSREMIELRRKERKPIKRANRRKNIKRSCCKECGQPKHYICLEHNSHKKLGFIKRIQKLIRYNLRKIFFNVFAKLGFIRH